MRVHLGDCLDVLAGMEPDSFDSCVTDPPAGIAFMGKQWDGDRGGRRQWCAWMQARAEAVYRVLKPGAHALVWALPRTAHWTATAWEDAGFEVREKRYHVFGSGFPKSLDVSKAIDKTNGEVGRLHKFTEFMRTTGLSAREINEATDTFMGSHYLTSKSQPAIPTPTLWRKLRPLCGDVPAWVDELVERIEAEREIVGQDKNWGKRGTVPVSAYGDFDITAPATEAARKWQGWGTATKPAVEEWILLRKPLSEATVAANVLRWGTGAVNVAACRVSGGGENDRANKGAGMGFSGGPLASREHVTAEGRWPPNLSHDGSPEALAAFARFSAPGQQRAVGPANGAKSSVNCFGDYGPRQQFNPRDETDTSPARFFPALGYGPDDLAFYYSGKAGKADRAGSNHATVKPISLMRWLCRLITPPGGRVLDCFAGSGVTMFAALREGFEPTGIEITPEHHTDILRRLAMMRGEDEGLFAPRPTQATML